MVALQTAPVQPIKSYQVLLAGGFYCEFLNLGGIIRKLVVPTAALEAGAGGEQVLRDVVLGYENLDDYLENPAYLGAVIGRYANRIAEGKFELAGEKYQLDCQNGMHLHGGKRGFSHQFFQVKQVFQTADESLFELTLVSPEEKGSYPASLEVKLFYHFLSFSGTSSDQRKLATTAGALTSKKSLEDEVRLQPSLTKPEPRLKGPQLDLQPQGELRIELKVLPNKKTPLNLTHHSYFQLNGVGNLYQQSAKPSFEQLLQPDRFWPTLKLVKKASAELDKVYGHSFQIFSDQISEVAEGFVWSGREVPLDRKPAYDFRRLRTLEPNLLEQDPALQLFGGIDNNYKTGAEGELRLQAYALAADRKLALAVGSSLPDLQFYTAGSLTIKGGKDQQLYNPLSAFCFEPQFAPNSLNLFADERTIFSPTKIFDHTIVYSFFG